MLLSGRQCVLCRFVLKEAGSLWLPLVCAAFPVGHLRPAEARVVGAPDLPCCGKQDEGQAGGLPLVVDEKQRNHNRPSSECVVLI